jgi:hypothetical protein
MGMDQKRRAGVAVLIVGLLTELISWETLNDPTTRHVGEVFGLVLAVVGVILVLRNQKRT